MKFIALNRLVACPVCDTPLTLVREQDKRVARMKHEGNPKCLWYGRDYRIDRITGQGEEVYTNEKPSEVQLPSGRESSPRS